jgi:hypothetical protein
VITEAVSDAVGWDVPRVLLCGAVLAAGVGVAEGSLVGGAAGAVVLG